MKKKLNASEPMWREIIFSSRSLIDHEYRNWRQYHTRYWPTLYVSDKKRSIQYTRIGEEAYEQTEETIQRLLAKTA